MNLKKSKRKDGRIYLSIDYNYRENGTVHTKTVRSLGYLDELEKIYDDPIAHFTAVKDDMEAERQRQDGPATVTIHPKERIKAGESLRKNLGFAALSAIYHELGIDAFLANRQTKRKLGYSLNSVMKLLVYSRILSPASKLSTWRNKDAYFERFDFTDDDVYRSLPVFAHYKDQLLKHLHEKVCGLYGRKDELCYYDVTNYYFEIDRCDADTVGDGTGDIEYGMRKKGVSKEHRPDPIVQMGLLMDDNALPITYKLHPGNTNDCITLIPSLKDVKRKFGIGRLVVVADKAMNSSDNIAALLGKGDGYVFSKSIRGATDELQRWALSCDGFKEVDTGTRMKSRIATRKINVTMKDGDKAKGTKARKKAIEITEKQVCVYSALYDARAKAARQDAIEKARQIVAHPGRLEYMLEGSAARYIDGVTYDKDTGEVIDTAKTLRFNEEKLKAEERFDGYYVISTSEVSRSDSEIRHMYKGLWRIEQSFKITKSELVSRPVFVHNAESIEAHFLTCFIALLIMRILEMKTNGLYTTKAMIDAMASYSGTHIGENWYRFDYRSSILDDIGKATSIDFSLLNRRTGDIRKLVGASKRP
jgi:transposase